MVNEYTILNQLFSSKKMFLSLLTSFLVSFHLSSSQDIVGCGGFVQSLKINLGLRLGLSLSLNLALTNSR